MPYVQNSLSINKMTKEKYIINIVPSIQKWYISLLFSYHTARITKRQNTSWALKEISFRFYSVWGWHTNALHFGLSIKHVF